MEQDDFHKLAHKLAMELLREDDKKLQKRLEGNKGKYNDATLQGLIYQNMAIHYLGHTLAICKLIGMNEEEINVIYKEINNIGLMLAKKIIDKRTPKKQTVN